MHFLSDIKASNLTLDNAVRIVTRKESDTQMGCIVAIFREHGLYQVRGFTRDSQHTNRAFRRIIDVRSFVSKCKNGILQSEERY